MSYTPGPYDSPHIYVQWGGKLPGGEHWSCGIRLRRKTGTTTVADEATLLTGVAAACSDYHTRGATTINNNAKLSFVKCNAIGTDGRYLNTTGSTEATFADVPGGTSGNPPHPNQIALCVTLTTGYSRGPAHKGRFYLPLPFSTPNATGLIDAAEADSVSDSTDTFLTALNAVSANFEAAVFSRKSGAAGNRKITGNLVGRALDTQRRRRRSLVEDYQ